MNKYRIESARMPGWNYASPGYYFLTVVCHQRQCLFGQIVNGKMHRNEFGDIVHREWLRSGKIRQEINIDAFVVMPDHFHAIVQIVPVVMGAPASLTEETQGLASLRSTMGLDAANGDDIGDANGDTAENVGDVEPVSHGVAYRRPKSVATLMSGFKSACTKNINQIRQSPGTPVWQARFYDSIIWDKNQLRRTREYIWNNPAKWSRQNQ